MSINAYKHRSPYPEHISNNLLCCMIASATEARNVIVNKVADYIRDVIMERAGKGLLTFTCSIDSTVRERYYDKKACDEVLTKETYNHEEALIAKDEIYLYFLEEEGIKIHILEDNKISVDASLDHRTGCRPYTMKDPKACQILGVRPIIKTSVTSSTPLPSTRLNPKTSVAIMKDEV